MFVKIEEAETWLPWRSKYRLTLSLLRTLSLTFARWDDPFFLSVTDTAGVNPPEGQAS